MLYTSMDCKYPRSMYLQEVSYNSNGGVMQNIDTPDDYIFYKAIIPGSILADVREAVCLNPTRALERELQRDDVEEPPLLVGQPIPNSASMNPNEALARLGRNPRDGQALIDAGQATLAIGDIDAAVGFFRRADQVAPGNSQVKAGLARALVHSGNPYDAIPQFDEAERAGAMDIAATLDRGLAYDLVADNVTAQRYYRQALAAGPNDEATRRLAISLAIVGDKLGSTLTLSALLIRQDTASWRARAFALAILGQSDEAVSVINTTLPVTLAANIAPYLRYMPHLTPAQQAAAANIGQFPSASEAGHDDARIARYTTSRRTWIALANAELVQESEPRGQTSRNLDSVPDVEKQDKVDAPATPPYGLLHDTGNIIGPLREAMEARQLTLGGDVDFRMVFEMWRSHDQPARYVAPASLHREVRNPER